MCDVTFRCSIFEDHSSNPNGGVAQLGEHLPCKQGVMGSNPIISTSGSAAPKARTKKAKDQAIEARFLSEDLEA